MSVVEAVATRLRDEIEALAGRVEGVADLAELMRTDRLPQRMPAAWVLSLGDDAEPAAAMTGVHRQRVITTVGVVLVDRVSGDAGGGRTALQIDGLRQAVIGALAGWQPSGAAQGMEYRRGRLVSIAAGAVFHQLDFGVPTWVRLPA